MNWRKLTSKKKKEERRDSNEVYRLFGIRSIPIVHIPWLLAQVMMMFLIPFSCLFDFCFYGNTQNYLFFNSNGLVTFDTIIAAFTSFNFPSNQYGMVTAFGGDVDTRLWKWFNLVQNHTDFDYNYMGFSGILPATRRQTKYFPNYPNRWK